MVFHWILSDSKSTQVSRTLLSILAFLNNAIVWMVSTRPPTFKSSRSFNNPLIKVPKAPITIGIIVTFKFHNFFNPLASSRYLSLFSHSFNFILWSAGTFFWEFFTPASADGLSLEFEWEQVSRTLTSILADFNSAVVFLFPILPISLRILSWL